MSRRLALVLVFPSLSALAAPPGFDPAKATPYFTTGPAQAARKDLHLEKWAAAATGFGAYVKQHGKAPDHLQAAFLGAYAASRAGRFHDAALAFDSLVERYPLLADHHRLYAARAYAADKQLAPALERARKIPESSPLDGEARLVRADVLRALARPADAEKEYQAYLDRYPASWREPEVRFRLGELAAADPSRAAVARAAFRDLYLRFPTDSWGTAAADRLRSNDPAALTLSGPDHLTRGLALFEAMRNAQSEAELKAALDAGGLDGKQRCVAAYHLAQSVFKARERPRAAPLFDTASALCAEAPATDPQVVDYQMKSLYQGARCHAAKGEPVLAATLFARAEALHPSHSFADDARLRQAEMWDAIADKGREARKSGHPLDGGTPEDADAKSLALLSDLADRYPTGDMRSEALFRLFFRAWKAGHDDDAQRWLDAALQKVPREEGWWDAGRTLYWMGRVAERASKRDAALAAFRRCAKEYPLSYYALSALNRMREIAPAEEARLAAELARPVATASDLAWRFKPRALFGEPGFLRGVELARLGLGAEARREFAALGIRAPEGPLSKVKPESPEAEEDLLWLVAVLYDRAGEYAQSHWIPRHTLTAYASEWPTGANRKRWILSYPRGYADLIVDNANKNGQPPSLEFAIVREESAFDPLNESFANAVGLTQLTQAPAKRFAEGLPYSREALRDPVINVTIGAREFGSLWARYKGNAALAIAGYNAGEGAVNRWLRAAPAGQTLDEYVESIPYDETRGYTKRVLSSYFAYHWLYDDGDPVPPLGSALPPTGNK